ncbi:MAG: class I SAM-dependent methyltransferase [Candidatus Peribacteraceae bacterium]
MQQKQDQWAWQWDHVDYDNEWLFRDWIAPNTIDYFQGKTVLDCGAGSGQHFDMVAPKARSIMAVDLNISGRAKERAAAHTNVTLKEADLAAMDLGSSFDIAYCIGVLHHTDDPHATFANIKKHVAPGGRLILWVYSKEGNALNQYVLEPIKTLFVRWLPRRIVLGIAWILTALLTIPIYTIYLLPLRFLPFYEYFQNWRKLSFRMNMLNVFDKLNAPQTWFLTEQDLRKLFNEQEFTDIHISPYRGVSWRGSGTKR